MFGKCLYWRGGCWVTRCSYDVPGLGSLLKCYLCCLQVTANCRLDNEISSLQFIRIGMEIDQLINHQPALALIPILISPLSFFLLNFGTHLTRKLFPVKAESYKFSLFQQQQGGRHTCYQEFTRKLLSLSRIILNCS